jgi:transcriptional regulator GlxA family with amidase domain
MHLTAKAAVHAVTVIAVPPVTAFDLCIPELMFGAVLLDDRPAYDVRVCTADPATPVACAGSAMKLVVAYGLDTVATADTVIVTGTGARDQADPRVLAALRQAAGSGKRIAAICTGAFVLAQAGLLDGRAATTYWRYSAELTRRFPAVDLQPDVLYVQDGQILTSAGLAAGMDLCLHMIRTDHGAATANTVARLAVVAPVRPGGQAQFVESALPPERGASLADTREWARQRLGDRLTLADLAAHARVSVRTLTRRFHAETGLSPLQWLVHQRVHRARELLEATTLPMDQVARHSGLGTTESLRRHLDRQTGLAPTAYRAAFTRSPR